MLRKLGLIFIASVSVLLGACASNHMTVIPPEQQTIAPEEGKALIHFMRPTSFGGAIQSTIYDGDEYIGTVSANTRVCYQSDPGSHMFMVVGESADFLQAELLPNKTYYVNVQPRMGVWKARFSFRPMNGQVPKSDIDKWVKETKEVKINEQGRVWASKNKESVKKLKEKYLPKWNEKSDTIKQVLKAESGI